MRRALSEDRLSAVAAFRSRPVQKIARYYEYESLLGDREPPLDYRK
ncbi:hypothetical protein [Aurantiacibacter suaedae]|nr:hypothetical protein [Aurantiacibacter suaedae]